MIDPNNREVLTRVYRMVERYETPPKIQFSDEATDYFTGVLNDLKPIWEEFPGNDFARCLCMGVYSALEERFKAVNEMPLKDRIPEPEQQSLF